MNVAFLNFLRFDKTIKLGIGFFCALFLALLFFFFASFFRPALLRVSFYDVGQGDAIFIETPSRFQVLVDGGRGSDILLRLAEDMPFYDRTLNLVVATHPDSDHISGLVDVLSRYHVSALLLPAVVKDSEVYARLLSVATERGVPLKEARAFQRLSFGSDTHFLVLNPLQERISEESNEAGVVGVLSFGEFDILLSADISQSTENDIMPFLPQDIEVLKVAHHGSKYSSGAAFLSFVLPQLSVIQVGENSYGHPAPETLWRLSAAGSSIWRTDEQGTLRLHSDGEEYWIVR